MTTDLGKPTFTARRNAHFAIGGESNDWPLAPDAQVGDLVDLRFTVEKVDMELAAEILELTQSGYRGKVHSFRRNHGDDHGGFKLGETVSFVETQIYHLQRGNR